MSWMKHCSWSLVTSRCSPQKNHLHEASFLFSLKFKYLSLVYCMFTYLKITFHIAYSFKVELCFAMWLEQVSACISLCLWICVFSQLLWIIWPNWFKKMKMQLGVYLTCLCTFTLDLKSEIALYVFILIALFVQYISKMYGDAWHYILTWITKCILGTVTTFN